LLPSDGLEATKIFYFDASAVFLPMAIAFNEADTSDGEETAAE
jgi:hypothetical protein